MPTSEQPNPRQRHRLTDGDDIYAAAPPQTVDGGALAQAQKRLNALPPNCLPEPALPPRGSRIPFARNDRFVGREKELKILARTLKEGQTTVIGPATYGSTIAVTGLGGVGKTQLAVEFVHRCGSFFAGGVFWLSFADPQAIPVEVAACGGPNHLDLGPDFGHLSLDDQVPLVLSAWQNPLPRLLIFNNCEDEALLARWRPPTGGSRVLVVTNRRLQWSADLHVHYVPLDVLTRAESVALLRKHRSDLPEEAADTIAEKLGDLPLTLHLAGSFLGTFRREPFGAPDAYLDHLRETSPGPTSPTDGDASWTTDPIGCISRTFALSFAHLDSNDATDAVALALLARAAYVAPSEPIPRRLLLATLPMDEADVKTTKRAEDGLARLVALGLLDLEAGGRSRLHRLLGALVLDSITIEDAQAALEDVVLAEANHPEITYGLNQLGLWRTAHDDLAGTQRAFERALAIQKQTLNPDDPILARSLHNLGAVLMTRGMLSAARPYLEQAVSLREAIYGPKHPKTATSLDNLASLLDFSGDPAGARVHYERALAIRERTFGPNHIKTAQSLNNVGILLLEKIKDYKTAQGYIERAATIIETELGSQHPLTAANYNNQGGVRHAMGDLAGARAYYERAWAIYEQAPGNNKSSIMGCLNNLGTLVMEMGDHEAAQDYLERALTLSEQVSEPPIPETITVLSNLGTLWQERGDDTQAQTYFTRALSISERTLGLDHPETQGIRRITMALEKERQKREGPWWQRLWARLRPK
jgi:tetratricopeptide (TPR) repeat protein